MPLLAPRSALFVPGNRPELIAKTPRSQPELVIIDLEDAVSSTPEAKAQARTLASEALKALQPAHPALPVMVRVNALNTPFFSDDLAVLPSRLAGVVVPKLERASDVERARGQLSARGLNLPLLAGLETAAGVWNALEILQAPGVAWAYFGAEDYTADLGGQRRADNLEVLYARSKVALAARLAGVHALDIVVTSLTDEALFAQDAQQGRALGYGGKLCIHPAQVAWAHQHFGATPEELQRAQRLLAAAERAEAQGLGAFNFEGQMVDEPLLRQAKQVIARSSKGPDLRDDQDGRRSAQ